MKSGKFCSAIFTSYFISVGTLAGTVNIDTLMQSSADQAVTKIYNQCVADQKKKGGLIAFMAETACKTRVGYAPTTLSNISVTSNGLGTSNLVISPVPTSVDNISTWAYNNCLDVPFPINQKVTATASESLTINKKTTIQTELSISTSGEYSFAGAKVGTTLSAKQIVTNENGSTFATNSSKTVEETINISVPPRTMYVFSVEALKYAATMDYFGDVFLDGLVTLKFKGTCTSSSGGTCTSRLPKNYSALVPNNTVRIDGSVASSYVSSTRWNYKQQPAVDCAIMSQKTNAITTLAQKSNGLISLNDSYVSNGFNNSTPKQVVKNIGNGLQITTANVVGSIQVRAKSLQPNSCKVTFIVNDLQKSSVLIPNTWSEWITISTFSGVTVPFVSITDECNGKLSAEVKYFE